MSWLVTNRLITLTFFSICHVFIYAGVIFHKLFEVRLMNSPRTAPEDKVWKCLCRNNVMV